MRRLWKRFTCWFFGVHSTERIGKLDNGETIYQCRYCGKRVELNF